MRLATGIATGKWLASGVSPRHKCWRYWGAFGVKKSKRLWRLATDNWFASKILQQLLIGFSACGTLYSGPASANQAASDAFDMLKFYEVIIDSLLILGAIIKFVIRIT
jgi:hypothetical protein